MGSAERARAMPSAQRRVDAQGDRSPLESVTRLLARYRAHILADLAVVSLVLALPLSLRSAPPVANAVGPAPVVTADDDLPRAQTVSRSATISAANDPATRIAEDVRPIVHYPLGPDDTLATLANFFQITPEVIAFSNGITDPTLKGQQGREILIPPGQGALYTVQDGDTVESVAARFKVEPSAIMGYNRLYFEPEHFGPGQLVFVPGAAVPALVWQTAETTADTQEDADTPIVFTRPAPTVVYGNGVLAWPVDHPVVSQYFWAYHQAVDLAVPYGSPIHAAADGTVVYAGWVAVGGLCVQIKHAGGIETGYYHTSVVFVSAGQKVQKGQVIARVGLTGVTTGPHVHFDVRHNGVFVNPLAYLR